ncbi:hypothetical protein ACFFVK_02925 [Flavobacterium gyeonganense]|uniref:HNH endonuclease n=1 Tax=Flavobacterium gyeonganense TaxID=1310418 RepID=A0ABV5H7T9_9FLAO
MRYINTTGYNPKALKIELQKKNVEIISLSTIQEKKDFLDLAANQIWTKHKAAFEKLSSNKCWFSEAYATVSDFQIEHFRPKKKVQLIRNKDSYTEARTVANNEGYWWLSYELDNFRLAGGKPNQFKGSYFPLQSGSRIGTPLNGSWKLEEPIFIDPCKKEDVELITYDGVEPKEANPDIDSIEHVRARISINLFGLKINKLKNARSKVFEITKNFYNSAELNWNAMNDNIGVNENVYNLAKQNFDNNCSYLVYMLKPNKEFTRMVLAFLIAANQPWVNIYVIDIAKELKFI